MIRHRTPSHDSEDSQALMLDLTTLLDIMFILLVFFILTAGVSYRALDLTLPAAASEETEPAKASHHIMLEIKTDGYALDGETFTTFEAMKEEIGPLLQQNAEKELVIAGDRNVSLERLLELLTFLESRGIDAANILMQRKD
ncbi:MAG: biopolymer transporter ExbD [Sneathiella sp.]|nr:biopolymer transporter ExbD [Sneathiella sp.]